jgi:osmotically-inducible protein OsmY
MADRYDEGRYRGEPYGGERGYAREDRGFAERAGDEVRSWFGDEEAERRRRMDERERERERAREAGYQGEVGPRSTYGRGSAERGYRQPAERGWSSERWGGGEDWRSDPGRASYERSGATAYGTSTYRGETGYGSRYGGGYAGESIGGYTRPFGERAGWEAGRRGQFMGRGPKGYQRSDARITEDVCDRLADDPYIDASNMEVAVNKGEVTLSGTVSDRDDKRRAEDLIDDISGVREVHNQLRVVRWEESGETRGTTTAGAAGATTTRR